MLALATAAVVVPLANVFRWLLATEISDWLPLLSATWQTMLFAVGGAVAALVVALPIAWLAGRYPGRRTRALEGAYYVASSLPAIIVALALVTFTLRLLPSTYQTVATVIAAYVLIFLPRALVSVRAGIAQIPESLEEAARSLGVDAVRGEASGDDAATAAFPRSRCRTGGAGRRERTDGNASARTDGNPYRRHRLLGGCVRHRLRGRRALRTHACSAVCSGGGADVTPSQGPEKRMTLQLSGVSKSFGMSPVLEQVNIDVERGSRLAIVGASGTGKSTLLRIIAGFERPTTGIVRLGGRILASPETMVGAHRRGIGYVAQDGALFPHLTVGQNIGFGLRRSQARDQRVREVLDLTSLDAGLLDRYPHQLSGGQQQRVALARALAPAPTVILLDEPFSALDTGLRAHTREAMVSGLERSGVTTVLVTHDQEEALSFGQQLAVISGGRLVQSGPPSELFDAPLSADIAEFLGDTVFLPVESHGDEHASCAFGAIRVRHDRSEGAHAVRAMLRPSQIRVSQPVGGGNARVVSVTESGSSVELLFDVGDPGGFLLTHRLPLHEIGRFRAGGAVSLGVEGGVVLYAATEGPEAVDSRPPAQVVVAASR